MSKATLVDQIRLELRSQFSLMQAATAEAKENATGDETRSEGKYDTRAIEASYLASAQAEQVASLSQSIDVLSRFVPRAFEGQEAIAPGALVEADYNGELTYFLLAPAGGGLTIEYEGFECTVLTPESPLYQNLLGSYRGDLLTDRSLIILGVS